MSMKRGIPRELSYFEQQQEALIAIRQNEEKYSTLFDLRESMSGELDSYSEEWITEEISKAQELINTALSVRLFELKAENESLSREFFGVTVFRTHEEYVEDLDNKAEDERRRAVQRNMRRIAKQA